MAGPIVELISDTDAITFTGDQPGARWIYNNVTLDAWYAPAKAESGLVKRPNANGTYNPGQVFTGAHSPILNGQFFGDTSREAFVARNRLVAMRNEGRSILMRVTDELGSTEREVWLLEVDAPFRWDFSHFTFDMAFDAPDPRRYGPTVSEHTGLPSPSSGLTWNLGTAASGRFFDWGTPGDPGQVTYTNNGATSTFPRIELAGGGFEEGFRITEVETGRELTIVRPFISGDVVTLDSRTQRATLNGGGDVTGMMTSRDWFEVPAGATRRYQINTLGAITGTPTMTLYAAPAYM
jgi:hypothetical protein